MLHANATPLAAIGFEQWKPDGTRMAVIAARGRFEIIEGVIRYAGQQYLVPDEDACRDRFVHTRWPEGISCPACSDRSIRALPKRDLFLCRHCRKQFWTRLQNDAQRARRTLWPASGAQSQ